MPKLKLKEKKSSKNKPEKEGKKAKKAVKRDKPEVSDDPVKKFGFVQAKNGYVINATLADGEEVLYVEHTLRRATNRLSKLKNGEE